MITVLVVLVGAAVGWYIGTWTIHHVLRWYSNRLLHKITALPTPEHRKHAA